MEEEVTFGEYVRHLRRRRKWSLHMLADATGLNYTHLSRMENDSTVPRADTVVKMAEALNGDLKFMLELADCLPRAILDRIISVQEENPTKPLSRTAGPSQDNEPCSKLSLDPSIFHGLGAREAQTLAEAISELVHLDPHQRSAVINLIHTLAEDDHD
jgi:transcriptional regulator with XRE-family HTH domain